MQAARASLPEVMGRIEGELRTLADLSLAVQEGLSETLTSEAITREGLRSAQNLDLITQSLAATAAFMRALVDQVPSEVSVRPDLAAAHLTLAKLAERLAGAETGRLPESEDDFLF
ncbi:MAG: hypothetical protein JO048_05185 [Methylobacteriaceae bacterium]|nr:hypothetical protein [Methylobacteriaceae bacterium]